MASVTLENVRKIYAGGVEAVKGVSLVMPDGSLLVSDDFAGAIYRIRYRG